MYEFVSIVGYACIGFFCLCVFYNLMRIFTLHVLRRRVNDGVNFTEKFGPWAGEI